MQNQATRHQASWLTLQPSSHGQVAVTRTGSKPGCAPDGKEAPAFRGPHGVAGEEESGSVQRASALGSEVSEERLPAPRSRRACPESAARTALTGDTSLLLTLSPSDVHSVGDKVRSARLPARPCRTPRRPPPPRRAEVHRWAWRSPRGARRAGALSCLPASEAQRAGLRTHTVSPTPPVRHTLYNVSPETGTRPFLEHFRRGASPPLALSDCTLS